MVTGSRTSRIQTSMSRYRAKPGAVVDYPVAFDTGVYLGPYDKDPTLACVKRHDGSVILVSKLALAPTRAVMFGGKPVASTYAEKQYHRKHSVIRDLVRENKAGVSMRRKITAWINGAYGTVYGDRGAY